MPYIILVICSSVLCFRQCLTHIRNQAFPGNGTLIHRRLAMRCLLLLLIPLLFIENSTADPILKRVQSKRQPAVFQAWNPIDMPTLPLESSKDRLMAAAKHDLMWEEPVSQLGYGVELVLGAVWDHQHGGLATKFTEKSKKRALNNRRQMLQINPSMIFLLEVRWRDAPGSFLPADSPFWKRDESGDRIVGWNNGPEPYYLLEPSKTEFAENIARQCLIAIDSGIYDGIMFDWDGHLPIVRTVRKKLGDEPLIVVNIHDRIHEAKRYGKLINGAFMELSPPGPGFSGRTLGTWKSTREALLFFETAFREPTVNCLEVWGSRSDLRRMRAATTLSLTHSDGYVLFADPNPLKTPDHLHDWYEFWDTELGSALGELVERPDGAYAREFEAGTVVYNPHRNQKIDLVFDTRRIRLSDGSIQTRFSMQAADGDIFLHAVEPKNGSGIR